MWSKAGGSQEPASGTDRQGHQHVELLDRAAARKVLLEAATAEHGQGCLLAGGPGVGKTSLVKEVLGSLAGEVWTFWVSGTEFSAHIPYGALVFLLSGLEPGIQDFPGELLQQLRRELAGRAQGRRIVFVVDDAEYVDELSAVVLSQLALCGDARLILVSQDCAGMAAEFTGLWRSGLVRRCDLDTVSFQDAGSLLADELGAPVSSAASFALWTKSEGNPQFLKALARDCAAAGQLVLQAGFWVLISADVSHGPHVADAVGGVLAPLTREQYQALELLAVAGGIPLRSLRTGSGAEVDVLQESGLVGIDRLPSAQARLKSSLVADVVRQGSEAGRNVEAGELASATVLMDRWKYQAAAELLAGCRTASAGNQEWAGRVRAALAESEARLRLREVAAAKSLLQEAERELETAAGTGPAAPRELAMLRAELLLAKAGLARHAGRYCDTVRLLGEHPAASLEPDLRVRAAGMLCEAWAMSGRQHDAVELADSLLPALDDPAVGPRTKGLCTLQFACAYIMAGAWSQARAMFEGQPGGRLAAARAAVGAEGQLAEGLFLAFAQDPDQALRCLLPVLAQLRSWDPEGFAPLAAAAAAYCFALKGDTERYDECLGQATFDADSNWECVRRARYFTAAAQAAAGDSGRAAAQFRLLADEERERGCQAREMCALMPAARAGDLAAAQRLSEVAAVVEGSLAELCQVYAKGLLNDDSQLLVDAVGRAIELGHPGLAKELGAGALGAMQAKGERTVARELKRIMRTISPAPCESTAADGPFEALTGRQREIVDHVRQGASNREIAARTGVSVRTVEGHLYQVYAKLQVASRGELAALVSAEAR